MAHKFKKGMFQPVKRAGAATAKAKREGVSLSNAGYTPTLTPATVDKIFVPALTTVYINGVPGP